MNELSNVRNVNNQENIYTIKHEPPIINGSYIIEGARICCNKCLII